MSDRDRDDERLAEVADELARELRHLRQELERDHRRREPPTGPLGLPRPPTPGEFMEFADEVAIPGLIAILETNIKLLEGLRRMIRMANAGRSAGDRAGEVTEDVGSVASEAGSVASDAGRETLTHLEGALGDLRDALEGGVERGTIPEDSEARDILGDIEEVQRDIERRLDEASRPYDEDGDSTDGNDGEESGDRRSRDRDPDRDRNRDEGRDADDESVDIDVDAELDSLRERYRPEDTSSGNGETEGGSSQAGTDGDGTTEDDDGGDDAGDDEGN